MCKRNNEHKEEESMMMRNWEMEDTCAYAMPFDNPNSERYRKERRTPPSEEYIRERKFWRTHDIRIYTDSDKREMTVELINLDTGEVEKRETSKMSED